MLMSFNELFIIADKTGMSLEHDEVITEFYQAFMHENALNPTIFPALRYIKP